MQTPMDTSPRRTLWLLLVLAAARLLLHVLLNGQYGFHRDELAVLDDARHLAWGFIAYPPLTPSLGRLELAMFGTSLAGFRFFSALAQCAAMVFAGLIARELGGRRGSQLLAAFAVATTPFSLLTGSMFMYTAFDGLWWVVLAWMTLRLVNTGNARWWLGMGLVIGLGMLTRYTILFCVAGLIVGVVATPLRNQLRNRWLWAGAALSLLVFLPNAIWQWQHDFISLDFLQHIHARDVRIGRTDGFIVQQLYANTGPLLLPLWLAGLWWLALARAGARYRVLGWMYLTPLVLFLIAHGRAYYLAPAYPMLLAAGAVAFEGWLIDFRPHAAAWMRGAIWIVLAAALVTSAVIALPLAPIDSTPWRISRKAHDNFAEQVGWPELVEQVATIYRSLPPQERARTTIFANNYGEAGAIDLYGPQYGLPPAVSNINSYWYRGFGNPQTMTVIVLGDDAHGMSDAPATCTVVGHVHMPHGVENEESGHPDIYLCRYLRVDWKKMWSATPDYG